MSLILEKGVLRGFCVFVQVYVNETLSLQKDIK